MSFYTQLTRARVCWLCVYYLPLMGHLSQESGPCKIFHLGSSLEVPRGFLAQ